MRRYIGVNCIRCVLSSGDGLTDQSLSNSIVDKGLKELSMKGVDAH
jgi:hypothetical protein